MRNFQINLIHFKRGDFYTISHKIVLNEIIQNKDFSEFDFKRVKFFNWSFKDISFIASEGFRLNVYNCQFNNVSFLKT